MKITKILVNNTPYLITEEALTSKRITNLLDYQIGIGAQSIIYASADSPYDINCNIYKQNGEIEKYYLTALPALISYFKSRFVNTNQFVITYNRHRVECSIENNLVTIITKKPILNSMLSDYISYRPFLIVSTPSKVAVTIVNDINNFKLEDFAQKIDKRLQIPTIAISLVNRTTFLARIYFNPSGEINALLEAVTSSFEVLRLKNLVDDEVDCFTNGGKIRILCNDNKISITLATKLVCHCQID